MSGEQPDSTDRDRGAAARGAWVVRFLRERPSGGGAAVGLPWRWSASAVAVMVLGVAIGATWWGSWGGAPVFDDHYLVVPQRCFGDLERLSRTVAFVSDHSCAYRPVRFWTYHVEHVVSGGAFAAHKVGNVFWHWLAACAAFWLAALVLLRTGRGAVAAWGLGLGVALLWALHPVQTDSVTYVSGRRDILVGLFSLLSLAALLRGEESAGRARAGWWALGGASFVLAALSKEVAVAVPFLWLAWQLRTRSPGAFAAEHPVLARVGMVGVVLAVLLVLWRGVFLDYSLLDGWWGGGPVSHYATAVVLQLRALGLGLGVVPLVGDYYPETIPLAAGFGEGRVLLALGVVGGVAALVPALWRSGHLLAWGLLFWFVALAPSAQVFPHHELFAEHYLYLPLFGLVLGGVALLDGLGRRGGRVFRLLPWVPALLVPVLAVQTAARNAVWADEFTLNRAILAEAPANLRARYNLGNFLHLAGEHDEAVEVLRPSRDAWAGSHPREDWVTLEALAGSAWIVGDAELVGQVARAMRERFPERPRGHELGARLAMDAEDAVAVERHARAWVERAPGSTEAPVTLALALATQGRLEEALVLVEGLDHRSSAELTALRCRLGGALDRVLEGCPP